MGNRQRSSGGYLTICVASRPMLTPMPVVFLHRTVYGDEDLSTDQRDRLVTAVVAAGNQTARDYDGVTGESLRTVLRSDAVAAAVADAPPTSAWESRRLPRAGGNRVSSENQTTLNNPATPPDFGNISPQVAYRWRLIVPQSLNSPSRATAVTT